MRFCYGDKNTLRVLEEAEFWKRQEGEHTQVILEVATGLEENYVNQLKEFQEIFNSTEAIVLQYIEMLINSKNVITPIMHHEIMQLINLTIQQSKSFVDFLGNMIRDSAAVKNNPIAIVVINHIRRESEYYIGIAKAFLIGRLDI